MFPKPTSLLAQVEIPEVPVSYGDYWFPEQASAFAHEIDSLYYVIFWLSTIFFVGIVGFMCYFCWKYRRIGGLKGEIKPLKSSSHNTPLEIIWSVIPSVILIYIFWVGATGYFKMRVPTDDCEEIYVKAQKWNWSFTYPNGDMTTELHLVRDKPVRLVMESPDVLHSLFIPAFRQKMDIVPGRFTEAYVMPTRKGEFRLACAEYCGEGHSRMRTKCVVHMDEEDRRKNTEWKTPDHPPWENGERLYKMHCSGCHRIDGIAATGPALDLIWGKDEDLLGGGTVKVTEQYVRDSILNPNNDIVAGYTKPTQMQAFAGKLQDDDVRHIIAFIKYLKDPAKFAGDETVMGKPESEDGGTPETNDGSDAGETEENTEPAETTLEGEAETGEAETGEAGGDDEAGDDN